MHSEATFEGAFESGKPSLRRGNAIGLQRIQPLNWDAAFVCPLSDTLDSVHVALFSQVDHLNQVLNEDDKQNGAAPWVPRARVKNCWFTLICPSANDENAYLHCDLNCALTF